MKPFIVAALLCLHVFQPVFADALNAQLRPLELVLERRAQSGECSVMTLRDTQRVRGLVPGSTHVSKSMAQNKDEIIRIYSFQEALLWLRAREVCTDILPAAHATPRGPSGVMPSIVPDIMQEVLSTPVVDLKTPPPPSLDVQPLLQSGSASNRVDLVFFSDGYTAEEKNKFIDDATRLAEDISNNQTFNTVRPLLNFWAAFTPSNESGIGIGGKPKNTTYGLYRDGTELRGVYYAKPEVARAACLSLGDQCDYPILMGNDPLYGGLGGEFTVITPSIANGALVLRHELGHSIIEVGEEYDGGFAYYGVNAAEDLSHPVSWTQWLTDDPTKLRAERSIMPMQAYPWTMLNTTKSWSVKFKSSGTYARHLVRFSLSGLPDASDLLVELDGKDLEWEPKVGIGLDRWHYDVHRKEVLKGGEHEVRFTLKNGDREGVAQLCSTEVLEFGTEDEFHSSPGYYGAFPTFSETNTTTFRPTNEDCLMRIVTTPNFCKACLEGLWLSLLRRVDFIDNIDTSCELTPTFPSRWKRTLDLKLVPLGQFRPELVLDEVKLDDSSEKYEIHWYKDGRALPEFDDLTHVEVDDEDGGGVGIYSVEVKFTTSEVRVDPDGLLLSGGDFNIVDRCGQ